MSHKKQLLFWFTCTLVFFIFLLSGCRPPIAPSTPANRAILSGIVTVPVSSRQLEGQALADAEIRIINPKTGQVVATAKTDKDGHYSVEVPAGGPYIVEASKGNIKVLDISPKVEAGKSYDLGTADATSTAIALIFQERVERGENPENINIDAIQNTQGFGNLVNAVTNALSAGQDPTQSNQVNNLVNNILNGPSTPTTPSEPSGPVGGTTSVPTPDTTAPQITALSFAGVNGTGSGNAWTVDISSVTNQSALDNGSMTVSEACTLTVKKIDGVDASTWFNTVTLNAGANTGGIKSLLGFTQDVTFEILGVQDTNKDGNLAVEVELKDSANNATTATITIKIDNVPPTMVKLTAWFEGKSEPVESQADQNGIHSITCQTQDKVTKIQVTVSEPVTVNSTGTDTPVVYVNLGQGNVPYGTLSRDSSDSTNKTLIVTPNPGNETCGLEGTFTFEVSKGAVKDSWGNENAKTTFILKVCDPLILQIGKYEVGKTTVGSTPSQYTLQTPDNKTTLTISTDSNASSEYWIKFAEPTTTSNPLKNEMFGLYLKDAPQNSPTLLAYYNARKTNGRLPENYYSYLVGAANGTNPFAYLYGGNNNNNVFLCDGARWNVGGNRVPFAVPGDFPVGTYTVEGDIEDIYGNTLHVSFTLTIGSPSGGSNQ